MTSKPLGAPEEESKTIACSIMGSRFHAGAKARLTQLSENHPLTLLREPDNKFDENAIKVLDSLDDLMLGYVPKEIAKSLAPKIDSGEIYVASLGFEPPFMVLKPMPNEAIESSAPGPRSDYGPDGDLTA